MLETISSLVNLSSVPGCWLKEKSVFTTRSVLLRFEGGPAPTELNQGVRLLAQPAVAQAHTATGAVAVSCTAFPLLHHGGLGADLQACLCPQLEYLLF